MNKYLIGGLILLTFSCAPKKIVTQSRSDVQTEIKNAITDTNKSENKEIRAITDQSATDTETTVKITTYDNDRPIDTLTGKHPIKEEKVITTKKIKKTDIKTDITATGSQLNTHSDNSKSNIDSKTEVKVKETPKTPVIKYWLYLAVLVVAVFLFFKFKSLVKN